MSVITPQVCNNLSAAGKPVANRIIAVAPNILPRIFNENHPSGSNSHTNVNTQTGSGHLYNMNLEQSFIIPTLVSQTAVKLGGLNVN